MNTIVRVTFADGGTAAQGGGSMSTIQPIMEGQRVVYRMLDARDSRDEQTSTFSEKHVGRPPQRNDFNAFPKIRIQTNLKVIRPNACRRFRDWLHL